MPEAEIGPAEIESCLVKHPAIANAAVIVPTFNDPNDLALAFVIEGAVDVAATIADSLAQDYKAYIDLRAAIIRSMSRCCLMPTEASTANRLRSLSTAHLPTLE